jgi:hypothetical protein
MEGKGMELVGKIGLELDRKAASVRADGESNVCERERERGREERKSVREREREREREIGERCSLTSASANTANCKGATHVVGDGKLNQIPTDQDTSRDSYMETEWKEWVDVRMSLSFQSKADGTETIPWAVGCSPCWVRTFHPLIPSAVISLDSIKGSTHKTRPENNCKAVHSMQREAPSHPSCRRRDFERMKSRARDVMPVTCRSASPLGDDNVPRDTQSGLIESKEYPVKNQATVSKARVDMLFSVRERLLQRLPNPESAWLTHALVKVD